MSKLPEKHGPAALGRQMYGASFCIVAARFNSAVVDLLVEGARNALLEHGVAESAIDVIYVPGALEIPLAVQRAARTGRFDGLVALGTVVRGGTPHFDYVSAGSVGGVNRVSLDCDVPVGNGILTVDTMQQAVDRAGGSEGNKGAEAALAAMEMVCVLRELGE
jgi:6,7-dimethyl-8-ribityllumazine synthase